MRTSAEDAVKSSRRSKGKRVANDKPVPPAHTSNPPAETSVLLLKPRRRLFFILLGALALWIAALIFMYLDTVYPQLHH